MVIKLEDIKVHFPIRKGLFSRTVGYVKAVDGVSFELNRGERLGIVGESGSGKSTLARVITRLQKPTAGKLTVEGRVGMIFQDPLGSLNPRMTIGSALSEITQDYHELLDKVGLGKSVLDKYPHEFSGGQRQRICIAKALAMKPEILVCDEATSALDLSIRSQILDLIDTLAKSLSLTIIFITHDLGVVRRITERLMVMQKGKVVETGLTEKVLSSPQELYTQELIAAVPRLKYCLPNEGEI